MSDMKMKPVIPVPKRAHGFSIDSIMRRDDTDRRSSPISSSDDSDQGDDITRHTNSPDEPHRSAVGSRIPPLHPSLPSHVQQLLLADASGRGNSELLALRSQAWAFGNQSIGGYPTVAINGTGIGMPPQLGHGLHTPGLPVHPGLLASSRDPFAMYPWMVARQGPGLMGFPYGHPDAGLLFHPYRKPKRIRTAFSPSQLLKLEHAFEKNHYVVGQERKELAAKLSLTETQVKVWFQNRRTKHKRVRSDDEGESGNISIDDDETATSSANCDETSQVSYVEQSS